MKRAFLILLAASILLMGGCAPGKAEVSSEPSVSAAVQTGDFKSPDSYIQFHDNIRTSDSETDYFSNVYVSGDKTYMTLGDGSGNYALYEIGAGKEKRKIADNAWGCYDRNGTLYYFVRVSGETRDTYNAVMNKDGKETVLANGIYYAFYGDDGIYYAKDADDSLYVMEYGGEHKSSPAFRIEPGMPFEAMFYDGSAWVCDADGAYRVVGADENQNEEIAGSLENMPKNAGIITIRNGYIYYLTFDLEKEATLGRYSISEKKSEKLPDKLGYNGYWNSINFTDNYCFYAYGGDLYRTDASFSNVEKVFTYDGTVSWVTVSGNQIFLRCEKTGSNGLTESIIQVDENGKVLNNFLKTEIKSAVKTGMGNSFSCTGFQNIKLL